MTAAPAVAPVQDADPTPLFEMLLAYKSTALLRTGIQLGVFELLASGPADTGTVAGALSLHPRGAGLLLKALVALRLLDANGDGFRLSGTAQAHLVPGRPGYLGDMAKVMASDWEWEALRLLPQAVRRGGPVVEQHAETPEYAYWEDFADGAGAVAQPTAERAAALLAPWAATRDRLHVLDMACGHGLYGYTLAAHQPRARIWSLDWPNVLDVAQRHAERLGVRERVTLLPGDMFTSPLGGPYDVVMVTNVLHHFSPDRCVQLLRRAHGVLAPGGRLVVVGFTVGDRSPDQDAAAHLFSVLMLVWTFAGEVHSEKVYEGIFAAAGFVRPVVHEVPALPLRVIVAEKG